MFSPITVEKARGQVINVQGLECHLPARGWIWNPFIGNKRADGSFEGDWYRAQHPSVRGEGTTAGVFRRSTAESENYWQPDSRLWLKQKDTFVEGEYWRWERWEKQQEEERKKKPDYEHPELRKFHETFAGKPARIQTYADLVAFKTEMWLYRLSGFWFSNKGEATYITGAYWYFLSVYQMDVGLPKYKEIDRDYFYFWQYCLEDPLCYGMIEMTRRRLGKSYRCGAIGLEMTSRNDQFNMGIQSKSDEDAKKAFKKTVVSPFRKLPAFFQPLSDIPPSGKSPTSALKFQTGKMSTDEDELESMIDFGSSSTDYYDGQKLGFYYHDEIGKTKLVDVFERWDTVKMCLVDDRSRIIGKSINTTTVEDMDKGGKPFLKMWKGSDHNNRGVNRDGRPNKQTKTGLYRFFTPAQNTIFIDKWGRHDPVKGLQKIADDIDALDGDQRAISRYKHKMPTCERDAFQADADTCVMSQPVKINERLTELTLLQTPVYRVGNFRWKDGVVDSEVEFVEMNNGKFMVCELPIPDRRNKFRMRNRSKWPDNTDMYLAGIDPFDFALVKAEDEKKMSKGSLCIKRLPHPAHDSNFENGPVCLYLNRPSNPEIFYEDCLMALFFYGAMSLTENNKANIFNYFEDRGYIEYMAWYKGERRGVTNTANSRGGGVNGHIAAITDVFLCNHLETVVFPILLEQWLAFNPQATTEYDAAMAFGYAEMLVKDPKFKPADPSKSLPKISDFISWYK